MARQTKAPTPPTPEERIAAAHRELTELLERHGVTLTVEVGAGAPTYTNGVLVTPITPTILLRAV